MRSKGIYHSFKYDSCIQCNSPLSYPRAVSRRDSKIHAAVKRSRSSLEVRRTIHRVCFCNVLFLARPSVARALHASRASTGQKTWGERFSPDSPDTDTDSSNQTVFTCSSYVKEVNCSFRASRVEKSHLFVGKRRVRPKVVLSLLVSQFRLKNSS